MVVLTRPAAARAALSLAAVLIAASMSVSAGAARVRPRSAAVRVALARARYPLLSIVRAAGGQVYMRTFDGVTNTGQPTYTLNGPGQLVIPLTTARGGNYLRLFRPRREWTHIGVVCVGVGVVKVLEGRSLVFSVGPCNGRVTWQDTYLSRDLRFHVRWRISAARRTTWVIVAVADGSRT